MIQLTPDKRRCSNSSGPAAGRRTAFRAKSPAALASAVPAASCHLDALAPQSWLSNDPQGASWKVLSPLAPCAGACWHPVRSFRRLGADRVQEARLRVVDVNTLALAHRGTLPWREGRFHDRQTHRVLANIFVLEHGRNAAPGRGGALMTTKHLENFVLDRAGPTCARKTQVPKLIPAQELVIRSDGRADPEANLTTLTLNVDSSISNPKSQ